MLHTVHVQVCKKRSAAIVLSWKIALVLYRNPPMWFLYNLMIQEFVPFLQKLNLVSLYTHVQHSRFWLRVLCQDFLRFTFCNFSAYNHTEKFLVHSLGGSVYQYNTGYWKASHFVTYGFPTILFYILFCFSFYCDGVSQYNTRYWKASHFVPD